MRLAILLAFSACAFGQTVGFGVEGGIPLTHDFTAPGISGVGVCPQCGTQRTVPYVIGPKVEIHFWRPLYLDAEALYSRADYAFSNGTFLKHVVDRWEIPILAKLQFNSQHFVRPFVSGGVSFQHAFDSTLPPSPSATVGPGAPNSAIGSTFAAGASFGLRWVHPSIEFRYTRWTNPPTFVNGNTVQSKQDEAQILAGLTFGVAGTRPDSRGVLEGPPQNRRVSLGIKGGLLLTDALAVSTRVSQSRNVGIIGNCLECGTTRTLPYVVGPALEVRILAGLSATAEAFYSHADYTHTSQFQVESAGGAVSEDKHAVGRWEAPLLLKYSFKMRHFRPFISAGASILLDRDSSVQALGVTKSSIGFPPPSPRFSLRTTSNPPLDSLVVGPTGALGASFDVGSRVRPSIEVRYTYWTDRAISVLPPLGLDATRQPGTPPTILSNRNQLQLLVGLTF